MDETICVKVCSTEEETSNLLFTVLDNNRVAADLLSKQVHCDTSELAEEIRLDLQQIPDDDSINIDDLGIWIDPIGWAPNPRSYYQLEFSLLRFQTLPTVTSRASTTRRGWATKR